MQIEFSLFPGGVCRAMTMSFDDGRVQDIPLAKLFDKYGIKGTFHYNSGNLGKEGYLTEEEVREIGKNHEISSHGYTHPFLDQLPLPMAVDEVLEDKKALERIGDCLVRGMSYPYGNYTEELIAALRGIGMEYSRTINNTRSFYPPRDFMKWDPTCHQSHDLDGLWEKFLKKQKHMRLFYIWGHSYEFDRDNSWERMEAFCKRASEHGEIWFATNIEVYDYIAAMRSLKFSADRKQVYNPSAQEVWLLADGEEVKIPPAATVRLGC